MNIKDEIKKCYGKTGKLAFCKISNILWKDICERTSFLNEFNPKPQERIYCILNDIEQVLYCPITKKKLRFSPQKKEYNNTSTYVAQNRIVLNPFDFKKKSNESAQYIFNIYHSNEYRLLSKDECINISKQFFKNNNSRITSTIARNHIDFVCSVFYHTKFIPIAKFNISERVYCLENNIQKIPTDFNGVNLKFQNRKVGYSIHASKKDMNEFFIKNASDIISENFIINEFIKEDCSGTTSRVCVTCKKCNTTFSPFFKNGLWKNIYCSGCNGIVNKSKMEVQMVEFLKLNNIENILENDREILNGYELDIYLPDYKLAIEMCGMIWHSFGTTFPNNSNDEKDKKYRHLEKYNKCKELGIKLITIFEHEWAFKQDLVKSIVLNKLNKCSKRIYARACEFSTISSRDANDFLERNHIQGKCSYSDAYGLYHNGELVSLMCFGQRKLTRGQLKYELIRFCSKMNTSVVGGASKILKHSNIKNFISYCDLRYSDGELYKKLGMLLERTSLPNYYYTKNLKVLHRMNFQKHKISKDGDSRSEKQIMYDNGYRRIYDCGNLVFSYAED